MRVRTYGLYRPPNGSATKVLQLPPGIRYVKLQQGGQSGLVIHWEDPEYGRPGFHLADTNGEVFAVDGMTETLWVVFPSTSTDAMEHVLIQVADVLLVPSVAAATIVDPLPVSLDFDAHLYEREIIAATHSQSILTGQSRPILNSNVDALTQPSKWRSVCVTAGNGIHTTVDLDAVAVLYDTSAGRGRGVLGTYINNKQAGGLPTMQFELPPFQWNVYLGNESGGTISLITDAWYSTNAPTSPAIR